MESARAAWRRVAAATGLAVTAMGGCAVVADEGGEAVPEIAAAEQGLSRHRDVPSLAGCGRADENQAGDFYFWAAMAAGIDGGDAMLGG